MNIVILDGITSNPGDLSWKPFEKLGNLTVHERSKPEEVIQRAKDAEIILSNKILLDKDVIEKLPKLKYIGILATGYNMVDLEAATEKGIVVTNIPSYSTQSVVQMVFAHVLNFTQRVYQHHESVQSGDWVNSIDFCYWNFPLTELSEKTFGVIGGGAIGTATAEVAKAFGMKVLIYTPRTKSHLEEKYTMVSLETLFRESDIVSLHCPLTPETKHLINQNTISLMKPEALLINTGRGLLIDEKALAEALNNDKIAGAGLDVLSSEPPTAENPLLSAKNCFITPHNAWATQAARKRLIQIAADNIRNFINNTPENVVN